MKTGLVPLFVAVFSEPRWASGVHVFWASTLEDCGRRLYFMVVGGPYFWSIPLQEEKGPRKKMTSAGIPSFQLASAVLHRFYVLRCGAEGLQSPAQRRQGPTTACEL